MSFLASSSSIAMIVFALLVPQKQKPGQVRRPTAPETFRATAKVANQAGLAGAAFVDVQVDKYTADADRDAMIATFKSGGFPALVTALRKAPAVGSVKMGTDSVVVRFAREQRSSDTRRSITIVGDKPMLFVGGGAVNAKPREGYELTVLQIDMDDAGVGQGKMAAAAKIKPGGPNGFELDDYADQPISLVNISRSLTSASKSSK
jgi:hypothetical protein